MTMIRICPAGVETDIDDMFVCSSRIMTQPSMKQMSRRGSELGYKGRRIGAAKADDGTLTLWREALIGFRGGAGFVT